MNFTQFAELLRDPVARGPLVLGAACVFNLALMTDTMASRMHHLPGSMAARLVDLLERRYNHPDLTVGQQRADGRSSLVFLIFYFGIVGTSLGIALCVLPWGWIPEAFLVGSLLSLRHIEDNLGNLQAALSRSAEESRNALAGLDAATGANARPADPPKLITEGACLAGTQFSNGLVAPIFWYATFGFPGLLIYKSIDVAARLIGSHDIHMESFGAASIRCAAWLQAIPEQIAIAALILAAIVVPGGRVAAPKDISTTLHTLTGAAPFPDKRDVRTMRMLLLIATLLILLMFTAIACYLVSLPLAYALFA